MKNTLQKIATIITLALMVAFVVTPVNAQAKTIKATHSYGFARWGSKSTEEALKTMPTLSMGKQYVVFDVMKKGGTDTSNDFLAVKFVAPKTGTYKIISTNHAKNKKVTKKFCVGSIFEKINFDDLSKSGLLFGVGLLTTDGSYRWQLKDKPKYHKDNTDRVIYLEKGETYLINFRSCSSKKIKNAKIELNVKYVGSRKK